MRLAFYLDDGLVCGGAERVARALLRHWVDVGWEVHLISRRGPEADFYPQSQGIKRSALMGTTENKLPARPRTVPRRLPGRSLLRFAFEALLLRRHLKAIAPDIAIAFLTPGNVKLLAAAAGLSCCVIISERIDIRAHRYTPLWRILRRLLYPRAHLVTANISATLDAMAHYVSGHQLVHLPNPVVLPPDEALAVPETSRRIIFVGRLVPQKHPMLLIEALSILKDLCADWHLDILGDGPLHDALVAEIDRCGLQGRVVLHGNVHDVALHFREAAIFVLPSAYEGTPNALLEAMAHALPCVVSDSVACAQPLVVDADAGLTFTSGDSADLARQLVALVEDPLRRKEKGLCARQAITASDSATAFAQWDAAILRACHLARETAS